MKILFVGDVHLDNRTPSSRKDDYPRTILNKIYELGSIAKQYQVDAIIYEGDVFNKTTMYLPFFTECLKAFKSIEVPQYSIVGNHDISYERKEEFDKSPLYLLFETGVVQHLKQAQFGDTMVYGFDYTDEVTPNPTPNQYSVCVAHTFFNNKFYQNTKNIDAVDAIDLHYNAFVLGHDHMPYEPIINNAYTVIRHGSLSRGSSHTCNLYRKINVALFDTTAKQFSYIEVPSLPANEVFKEEVVISKSIDDSFDEVIDNLTFNVESSIYDVIDQNEIPQDILNLIVHYLESNGIYRTTTSHNKEGGIN